MKAENPIPKWIVIVVLAWSIVMFAMAYDAMGATAYYPVMASHTDIDSVKVYIKQRGGSIDSSNVYTTIPFLDSIPLTIGKHYDISVGTWFAGEADWLFDPTIPVYIAPDLPTDIQNIRFVDADASGNNNGLSWSDAWTHPDSISTITTGSHYTIYVDADDYDPVDACSLNVPYMKVIGVNGMPVFHYNTDTLTGAQSGEWDPTGNADVSECIYTDQDHFLIENIRFTGEGLFAYPEYGSDPDGSLSTAYRGGKNAIFLENADFGTIQNCKFDSAYKPIVAYKHAQETNDSACYGITIQNCEFIDVEYHAIDAALLKSVIRNNTFIVTNPTNHPAAGAIQLISDISGYNMVYDNYFHGFGYAVYFNVSDSNFAANNWFGSEIINQGGDAMRVYDATLPYHGPYAWFVGNHIAERVKSMPMEGGRNLLSNSGFEIRGIDIHDVPLWAGNDWSQIQSDSGASFHIAEFGFIDENVNSYYRYGDPGHSLFIMMGGVDADPYMHQNSNVIYLEPGKAQFSARVLPNTPIVSGDSIRFALFEDTLGDGTFSMDTTNDGPYYFTSNGGSNWELAEYSFTVDNAGEYYFNMSVWNVDSGDGFYFDDIFLGQYAGEVTATASITTGDKQDIAGYVKDTALANPGAFYGPTSAGVGSDTVVIYAVDTSGTDSAVQYTKLTVKNAAGANVGIASTDGSGKYTFFLDPADYTVIGTKIGYLWNSLALTVTGNSDSETVKGYNIAVSTPSDTGLCNVYGYVSSQGSPVPYVNIQMTLPQHAYDSCNNTFLLTKVFSDDTDENGMFSLYVPKSSCLNRDKDGDMMEYKVVLSYDNTKTKEKPIVIPADSSSYYLVF